MMTRALEISMTVFRSDVPVDVVVVGDVRLVRAGFDAPDGEIVITEVAGLPVGTSLTRHELRDAEDLLAEAALDAADVA